MILNKEKRKEICAGYVTELTGSSDPPKAGRRYTIEWRNKHGHKMPSLGKFEVLSVELDGEKWTARAKIVEELRLPAQRSEIGYVTDPVRALRDGIEPEPEAVDEASQREITLRAKERWDMHRQETASDEERRKQERAVRQQLRETLPTLSPPAQIALLAGVKRLIEQAPDELDRAA